ncbi:amidohydrolase [Sandaracinobacter neustonicus]|uniref:Amidohydrolase n=1 Tax=Sandaracinobacter neustonicus TaxID=1715348 RepID=A0A501XES8_9SPHN|nr:amidohydrolase [Sandaracinobacter neustonicus]TPE59072.1 amidohydrolase [Sandaracinobacter neustonicus]
MICRLLAATALLLAAIPADAAKTLIVNANGYTMDSAGNLRRFSTLFVGDDGKVLAIMPRGTVEPKLVAGDFRLDAKGRTLIPGLIDAHGHIMALGLQLRSLDLTATTSLADAQTKIAAYAAKDTSAGWIRGGGWNQVSWGLGRMPTAAELDAAYAARPVWLSRVDGHAGWANTAALKVAGITKATKDPAGGRILRDAAGNPTGVLIDAAMDLVEKAAPPPSAGEREKALEAALAHLASVGLTGVHDMGSSAEDWALFRTFGDEGRLTLRITAYAAGMPAMEAISPLRPTPWLYNGRLKLQGIKLMADGALGSRGAWLLKPYSDEPGTRGLQFLDDAKMKNLFSRANYLGYQVAVHAIGDAANRQALDAFTEIRPAYSDKFRNRIEHAQVIDPADIPRFAELNIIASVQPTHATSDKAMAADRLGEARLTGAYAWATLRKAGVKLALGSDFPVEPANPFYGLHAAVTRQDRQNQPPGGWRPEDALTLQQAFAGFTTDAAWAGGQDGKAGQLTEGSFADFLLLDRDPFTIGPAELPQVVVEETWLDGKRVYVKPAK